MDLHVSGALVFLEDEVVHAALRLDERGGENGEAATFLEVARRTEEFLGLRKRLGIDAAAHRAAAFVRLEVVVAAGEAGDAVEQDHDILAGLDEALRALGDELRDENVPRGRFVERAAEDVAIERALEIGNLLGALVHEQQDEVDIGMVAPDRLRDLIEEHGLAAAWRSDDEAALPHAERRHEIERTRAEIGMAGRLEQDATIRKQRRQFVEIRGRDPLVGGFAFHGKQRVENEALLALLRQTQTAMELHSRAQVLLANEIRRHEDVFRA